MKNIEKSFFFNTSPEILKRARDLRKTMTETETALWNELKEDKMGGHFRRQHSIGRFIVDFYCHKLSLVIELDGKVHLKDEVMERDEGREHELKCLGLHVLRFKNEVVLNNIKKVISTIQTQLKNMKSGNNSSSLGGRQGGGKKALFCWSGGKDSAFALYKVLRDKEYEVTALFTTINENFHRVSMHGVREELIEQQAKSIGLPWHKMYVKEGSNAEYEKNMETFLLEHKAKGVEYVIFGDIFLEDLRAYRDNNLAKVGIKGVYPLWKQDTKQLADEFIKLRFKTVLCCTNDAYLGEGDVGQLFTESFVKNLPANVDPCGENGEFHSFCFDGPIFRNKIEVKVKEKLYKPLEIKTADHPTPLPKNRPKTQGFWFCELVEG